MAHIINRISIRTYSTKIPESHNILDNISDFEKNQNITPLISYFREKFKPKAEPNTLMAVLTNPVLLQEYVGAIEAVAKDKNLESKLLVEPLAAIYHRVDRFFIKFGIIEHVINNGPRKNLSLSRTMLEIAKELKYTRVYLNLKGLGPHGIEVSPISTIKLIKTRLTALELRLKGLLPAIAYLYDIPNPLDLTWFNYPKIKEQVEQIAPQGVNSWLHDTTYVFRTISTGSTMQELLSPTQWKQFLGLEAEVLNLLVLLRYKESLNLSFDYLIARDSHVINLPLDKFFTIKPMSNETYSRFVTVYSRTIILLYIAAFSHIVKNSQ